MAFIADYCPKECRVCPSSHGLKGGGIGRQKSTPFRPTEKTFQGVQVGFIPWPISSLSILSLNHVDVRQRNYHGSI